MKPPLDRSGGGRKGVDPTGSGGVAEEVGGVVSPSLIGDVLEGAALHGPGEDGEHGLEGGLGFAALFEEFLEDGGCDSDHAVSV